jgi:hypothetical protein
VLGPEIFLVAKINVRLMTAVENYKEPTNNEKMFFRLVP